MKNLWFGSVVFAAIRSLAARLEAEEKQSERLQKIANEARVDAALPAAGDRRKQQSEPRSGAYGGYVRDGFAFHAPDERKSGGIMHATHCDHGKPIDDDCRDCDEPLTAPSAGEGKDLAGHGDAWLTVCGVLHEVSPGFMDGPERGIDCAVAAIRKLAAACDDYQQASAINGQTITTLRAKLEAVRHHLDEIAALPSTMVTIESVRRVLDASLSPSSAIPAAGGDYRPSSARCGTCACPKSQHTEAGCIDPECACRKFVPQLTDPSVPTRGGESSTPIAGSRTPGQTGPGPSPAPEATPNGGRGGGCVSLPRADEIPAPEATERERFEEWARVEDASGFTHGALKIGYLTSDVRERYFRCWQAARSTRPMSRDVLVAVIEGVDVEVYWTVTKPNTKRLTHVTAERIAAAIEEAGRK